jgi:hypothetical protein
MNHGYKKGKNNDHQPYYVEVLKMHIQGGNFEFLKMKKVFNIVV